MLLIIHHCYGCCSTREEAIQEGAKRVNAFLKRRVQTPALNRWILLYPVVGCFMLMCGLHYLLVRAYLDLTRLPEDADQEPISETDLAGAPNDETSLYRRTERIRARKSMPVLSDLSLLDKLFVWQALGKHIAHIHYYLFGSTNGLGDGKRPTCMCR
jgi:hypothetical protein